MPALEGTYHPIFLASPWVSVAGMPQLLHLLLDGSSCQLQAVLLNLQVSDQLTVPPQCLVHYPLRTLLSSSSGLHCGLWNLILALNVNCKPVAGHGWY